MSMRPRNASEVSLSKERMYELIRQPLVTEKSTLGSEHGQVTFIVPLDATKPEIKVEIEGLFDKKVKAEVAEKKKQFEYYVAENKAAEEAEAEKLERRELGRLKAKYEKGDDPDEAEERQRLSELKRKFDV